MITKKTIVNYSMTTEILTLTLEAYENQTLFRINLSHTVKLIIESYFASQQTWIKDVCYNGLWNEIPLCFLEDRILVSTCNHVGVLLFKLDYAWQAGMMTTKPCISTTNHWLVPSVKTVEPVVTKDMVIRKPHFHRQRGATQARSASWPIKKGIRKTKSEFHQKQHEFRFHTDNRRLTPVFLRADWTALQLHFNFFLLDF